MGRKLLIGIFTLILLAGFIMVSAPAMAAEEEKPEQFMGILAYRTGPFAAGGSGFSSGVTGVLRVNIKQPPRHARSQRGRSSGSSLRPQGPFHRRPTSTGPVRH